MSTDARYVGIQPPLVLKMHWKIAGSLWAYQIGKGTRVCMNSVIVVLLLGVYIGIAIVIARFCAANAGWDKLSRLVPRQGGGGVVEGEEGDLVSSPADLKGIRP